MACRTCKFFDAQKTATGRIKRAAGRCTAPVAPLPPLPSSVDMERLKRAFEYRFAVWPNDGDNCPVYREKNK